MSDIKELYLVHYWFYGDTETMHSVVFLNKEDADKFEDLVWNKCQKAHIELDVTRTECIPDLDTAISELDELLNNEEVE